MIEKLMNNIHRNMQKNTIESNNETCKFTKI